MSFDLFVYCESLDDLIMETLSEKLNQQGLEVKFLSDFKFSDGNFEELIIECRLKPPLINKTTEFYDLTFDIEWGKLDPDVLTEFQSGTNKVELVSKLSEMKQEVSLSSSTGRQDMGLILQCYLSAALAEALDGLLFDPQEHGLIDGHNAFKVAENHCAYELSKFDKATDKHDNRAYQPIKTNEISNKKTMTPTTTILLVLLFIAFINILKDM